MYIESKNYRASLKEAYDASLEALRECGFEITEQEDNFVKATSSPSILSWGEVIEVLLIPESEGVKVRVTSSPTAQLFDWGKSKDNVSRVLSNLDGKLMEKL